MMLILWLFKTKLNLPQAQISDNELDTINRMNKEREQIISNAGNSATKALLGEISQREQTPMTMRTPMVQNSLMHEARKTHELMNAPTPLVGGQNPDIESGVLTKKPQNTIAATPNTLYQQSIRRPDSILRPKDTVKRMPPPGVETPMRAGFASSMQENDLADSAWESNSLAFSVSEKQQQYLDLIDSKKQKISLLQSFQNMPAPKNIEKIDPDSIIIDERMSFDDEDKVVEDREITEQKKLEELRQQELERLAVNSYAARTDLPRPAIIDSKLLDIWKLPQPDCSFSQLKNAKDLIDQEMYEMYENKDYDENLKIYLSQIDENIDMVYLPSSKSVIHNNDLTDTQKEESTNLELK